MDDNIVIKLTKKELDNFCKYCGACCRQLYFTDKLEIFLSSGRIIIGTICKYAKPSFSKLDGGCTIHDKKPKICGKWTCGVVEHLKEIAKYDK